MPRLILLNGPPACGKSTLAGRYADDHPLTLNLDIDIVRGLIGGWTGARHDAGLLARAIAVAAARTHLAAGQDVVMPQFLGRVDFIENLERLAASAGASFHEIVLWDTKENAVRRFRARPPLEVPVSDEELSTMYDRLRSLLAARPNAMVIHTAHGQIDEAYRALRNCIGV